jgi:hypothetical protein
VPTIARRSPSTISGTRQLPPITSNRSSVLAPGLVELGGRHAHALGEDVARHDVAGVAADVGDVGDRAQERDHAAAWNTGVSTK